MPTPSEQLLTRTVYNTDGVTTNWDFAFSGGYLDKSHVNAYTEASTGERTEIIVTEAMLVGPYQVRIAPALAAGLILTVYRDTPKDLPLVDFTDESGFSEIALDTNAKQAVFIAAETTDTVSTSSSYDAEQAASQAAIAAAAAQVSANAAVASALTAANEADASAASAVLSANSAASSSAAATTVFNVNTTAYTRTLLDDTSASTARTTLGVTPANIGAAASGANADITSLTALTTLPTALTPIGSGQTWQNMTASRNLVSSYTNSSGRPISISVRVVNAAAGNFSASISVGGVVVGENFQYTPNAAGNNNSTLFSIVPNGAVYGVTSFSNCTLQVWAELR